jgi:hypothetical protein
MVVIDNRSNTCYCNLSRAEVGRLVGVSRVTVFNWSRKRSQDGSHREEYNHFEIFFKVVIHKQKKGSKHRKPPVKPVKVFRRP